MARLKDLYKDEVAPALMKKFEYKSSMQIPEIKRLLSTLPAATQKTTARSSTPYPTTSALSPVRSRSYVKLASPSQTLKSVRACPSVLK